jgi:hypothetical protein
MTPDAQVILGDPIFQLNLVLWALQPAPADGPIRPILRDAGYLLNALSRELHPPYELRPRLKELVGSDSAPVPDVLAEPPQDAPWLVIECKSSGFGTASSTTRQALKLLAVSADLRSSLGRPGRAPQRGAVVYLTRSGDRDRLLQTLRELQRRLADVGVDTGGAGAIGLASIDERDRRLIVLQPSQAGDWPGSTSRLPPEATVMFLAKDEDPRPLYLVPWDPSVQQAPEMRQYCRAVLFARVASEAISVMGHATVAVPDRFVLKIEPLLSAATFGVSDRWRSKSDLNRTIRECKRFLTEAMRPLREQLSMTQPSDPERIELTLRSQDDLNKALDALLRANPLAGPPPEPEGQLSVLDQVEET